MQMPTQPQATVRQSESAYAKFVTKSFVLNNSVKKHKRNHFIKNFKLPIRKKKLKTMQLIIKEAICILFEKTKIN